jgi:hypothetical protein
MKIGLFASLIFFLGIFSVQAQYLQTLKRLPDTGENQGYTVTFGEDNDYLIYSPFFVDNGDGTVSDTITGLMWQKTDGGEMTIESAITYCDTLSLAGNTDWRLPNAIEAYSILNHQFANPSLDPQVFSYSIAEYWWTSESQANDSTKIWVTNAGGGIGNHPKNETISAGGSKRFHVRAVRSEWTGNLWIYRFEIQTSGAILDHFTQLEWNPNPSADSITWEEALSYAESANALGYEDWRLPNIKELQSLNDEQLINPSVDPIYFPDFGNQKFWSSTSLPNQSVQAWFFETHFGITSHANKTGKNKVLLVRNQDEVITGIIQIQSNQQPFPNPFQNQIHLNSFGYWTLINSFGEKVVEGFGSQIDNLETLPKGLYEIKFENGQFTRLIKQ